MALCPGCGNDNLSDAAFCVQCGTALGGRASAVDAAQAGSVGATTRTSAVLLDRLRRATLGEYEIQSELGRGGMAVVYLAHDIALDRKVAIKVISPGVLWLDEGIPERFKREARTAASLSHPHIIPIYAVKESEDLLFFVMKFVKGRTLESVIAEVGPLPIAMVHTILVQVGSALGYAHRQGVVHRDIKPGNIMLDEEGWAVVTDFGIAKVAAAEALTQTGGTVGTPAYMSPEQCAGLAVTGASDQYSLGIVAYEMLIGRKPFEAETAMALMYKQCNAPPPPIQDAVPDCPPALASAIMRMLEKPPESRWPRLEDMVAALGAVPPQESDRVRTQMLTLAQSEGARAIVEKFRTPSSPVPRGRLSDSLARRTARPETPRPPGPDAGGEATRRMDAAPALPSRRIWKVAAPAVAAAAVVGVVVWGPWRGESRAPTATEPSPPRPEVSGAPPAASAAAVEVVPASGTLIVGDTARLAATVLSAEGEVLGDADVMWESSNPEVARVSSRGLVSGLMPGEAEITAESGGRRGAARIVVGARSAGGRRPPPPPPRPLVAAVSVRPESATLLVGDARPFEATPRDADGRALADRPVTWISSDEAVARVSEAGLVTAVGAGTVRITAASEGRTAGAVLTVEPAPPASVSVSPEQGTLRAGESLRLGARVADARGRALAHPEVVWRSEDPAVAVVSPDGRVTGVAPGEVSVWALAGSVRGGARITVRGEAPAPGPVGDPRPAIEAALEAYRQAIAARDVGALRRVYPAMTDEQERGWSRFFETVRDLEVTLVLRDLAVVGDTARAVADMRLAFRSPRPSQESSAVEITLVRTAGGWQIAAVR